MCRQVGGRGGPNYRKENSFTTWPHPRNYRPLHKRTQPKFHAVDESVEAMDRFKKLNANAYGIKELAYFSSSHFVSSKIG